MGGNTHRRVPRHVRGALESYGLLADAELQRLDAEFQRHTADSDLFASLELLEDYCPRRFSLCAELLLPLSVSQNPAAIGPSYELALTQVTKKIERFLATVLRPLPAKVRQRHRTDILLKLNASKLSWLAEAKRRHLERHPLPPTLAVRKKSRPRPRVDSRVDRPTRVDRFLKRCNHQARPGEEVTRTHIWRALGYTKSRQFEYWQEKNEKKETKRSARLIEDVLAKTPSDFLNALRRQKLI